MVSAAQVHAALTVGTLIAARRCCPIVRVRAAGVTRARVSRAGAVAGRGRTERALSERIIGRGAQPVLLALTRYWLLRSTAQPVRAVHAMHIAPISRHAMCEMPRPRPSRAWIQ